MALSCARWTDERFVTEREEVLATWPTGRQVDLDDAVRYRAKLPQSKVFSVALDKASSAGSTLAQPRAGVALMEEHIRLLTYLQDAGEADLLPTTVDSYTRQNRYEEAQKGIEESQKEGRSMLNGLPVVNYGPARCREIVEALRVPVQVRHGTPDARLLAEVSLAAGLTAFEGGGISYNIPYAKNVPLEVSIERWQYVDRLAGIYEERGASINREPFGPLTGTLVAPCVSHAVGILEALLAAAQGVKNITLGYGQLGNLIQDVAAMVTLTRLAREFLGRFGFGDVVLTTVFHQWMGGFPQDEARAYGVIAWGAAAAALSKATKVITKSPEEAVGVPGREANAAGIRTTKQMLAMLRDQRLQDGGQLSEECGVISLETRAILDTALALGEGDFALAAVRGFEAGVIDVPFAPSRFNKGLTMPARDNEGAVRFLNHGHLPLPPDVLDFHRRKIEERARAEGRPAGFQMVMDDIYAISKGRLVGRPR